MVVIINDKVYGTKKEKPLTDADKDHIKVLRRLLKDTIEKKQKLEQEGLQGFGEDSERLYWGKMSQIEDEIERLEDRIKFYRAEHGEI